MHPRCQLLSGHLASGLRTPQAAQRPFTTSSSLYNKNPLQRRKGGDLGSHLPKHVISQDPHIPDYPHGGHALFKQADKGLYGESMIQFGNNVSRKTKTTTRRKWTPNVLSKSLYSVALKKRIKLRITSNVMKTVDREGGLDEYLLKDSPQRIKELGPTGWALRWTLMQRPVVIDRLRAEAAALGLDQVTIDKQWPTPELLSQQKYADRAFAREQALVEASEVQDVEQGMWDGLEGAEDEVDGREATISHALSTHESWTRKRAYREYVSTDRAAQRYLQRGLVDSEVEGLKLAFIRARERSEARGKLDADFQSKARALFSPQDLADLKTRLNLPETIKIDLLHRIAYNQRKRAQIQEAGGYEAWQEERKTASAEKAARKQATIESLGGPEALLANRKAAYAKAIAEAETASTNLDFDEETRQFYESAINKADRAIKAKASGGAQEYVDTTIEEIKHASNPGFSELFQGSSKVKSNGVDAWAALVKPSNGPVESRPNL